MTSAIEYRLRIAIANEIVKDIPEGWYVNLGIGMPTSVAEVIVPQKEIVFHSENGMLGMGPRLPAGREDPNIVNAAKEHVGIVRGGCFMSHCESFALIRGGHLDLCVLGAYQVARNGDLASWSVPGSELPAVGGAMDLALGAKQVWVMMKSQAHDGSPKLVERCTYPLTAPHVVNRIYTERSVIEVTEDGFNVIRELDLDSLERLDNDQNVGLII